MSADIETTRQEPMLTQYKKSDQSRAIRKPYAQPDIIQLELTCIRHSAVTF